MKNTLKGGMGGKQGFPPKKDKGKDEKRGGAPVEPPGVNGGSAPDRAFSVRQPTDKVPTALPAFSGAL